MAEFSVNTNQRRPEPKAGLCLTCQHMRRIESERGSVFVMCQLSFHDSAFPKYPRLPVVQCGGYLPK